MWPGELLAELKIDNQVVVLSEKGVVEADGIIESIDKRSWSATVTVCGKKFDITGYSGSKYTVLNKNSYEQSLADVVLKKYSGVVDKKIAFVKQDLSSEDKENVLKKLMEIDELLNPALSKTDKNLSYEFKQRMYGNEALTLDRIKIEQRAEFFDGNNRKQTELAGQLPETNK